MWSSSTYSEESRNKNARALVDKVFIRDDGTYGIKDKIYIISLNPERCTCDDFIRHQKPCKHIRAVRFRLVRQEFLKDTLELISTKKEEQEFTELISFMKANGETINKMELYDRFDEMVDKANELGIIADTGKTFTLMR